MVLALAMSLAAPARSGQIGYKSHAEAKAALAAVLDNEWIEKLPYVTDLQPGWIECGDESKGPTSVETDIIVMTDTEAHRALLEKQVPGSLEGFPVVVGVDRSDQFRRESEKMMAMVKPVIDDPANKWILRIPHVTRMIPSTEITKFGEPITAAVGIAVDNENRIKEVQNKVPKTIGGFPTKFGWVDDGLNSCFTNTGKGCDPDDDVTVDTSNPPILSADDDDDDGPPLDQRPR
jgi:hypothetical protein